MSKKFINNKFNGAINGKRCKDYYKEAIKNSDDKEYIEKCQKKIDEFLNQLKVTEFEDEVEYEKVDNDEIKRRITMDYEGRIDNWN